MTGGGPRPPTNDALPAAPLPSASFSSAPKAAARLGELFLKLRLFRCHLTRSTDAEAEAHSWLVTGRRGSRDSELLLRAVCFPLPLFSKTKLKKRVYVTRPGFAPS